MPNLFLTELICPRAEDIVWYAKVDGNATGPIVSKFLGEWLGVGILWPGRSVGYGTTDIDCCCSQKNREE